jgi:CheY-like chemotaxis protein
VKLSEFLAEDLKRAIELYLDVAWGPAAGSKMPKLPDAQALKGRNAEALLPPAFKLFTHEPPERVEPPKPGESILPESEAEKQKLRMRLVDQYTLRLGNPRYAFMKLVLGEHLIVGEYFLSVDTHEWMLTADPTNHAEVAEFAELRAFNADLKRHIEERWTAAKLPTLKDLTSFLSSSQMCAVKSREQRILVVDDDEVAAETLAAFLGSRGFDVELARDGVEALERADPSRHQLLILDVDMPRKDGLTACAELKADPARREIPVLLSSLRPLGDQPPAGANAFLVKPFQADALLYFIESLLRR